MNTNEQSQKFDDIAKLDFLSQAIFEISLRITFSYNKWIF